MKTSGKSLPGRAVALAVVGALLGVGLPARSARADEPPQGAKAPELARRGPVIGYLTQSERQLPLLQYAPYQGARRSWLGGFCSAMAGSGVVLTGVLTVIVGSQATGSLTEKGRDDTLAAGGALIGIGAASVTIGAVFWHLGRRDLLRIERGLPPKDGILPAVTLMPDGRGQVSLMASLGGRF